MNIFHQLNKFRKKDSKKIHENSEEIVQSFEELLRSETEKTIPPASCWVLNGESKVTSENFKGETKIKSGNQAHETEKLPSEEEWRLSDANTLIIYRNGKLRGTLEEKQRREEVWENVTKVIISENIKEIPIEYFRGMKNLQEVVFPSSLFKIGFASFKECTELKKIDVPEGVTTIAARAFEGCINLEEVTIPSTVRYIGDRAFATDGPFLQGKLKDIYVSKECTVGVYNSHVKKIKKSSKSALPNFVKSDAELQKIVVANEKSTLEECKRIFELGRKNIRKKEYKRAIQYICYAAEHGYKEAYFLLGYCYERGIGVTLSNRIAENYYHLGMISNENYEQYKSSKEAFLKAAEEGEKLFKNIV